MTLLKLFLSFFKIGLFTFGGGYAMIPLIKEEVLSNDWLSLDDLVNFIAISESTPGPFAINIATYIGSTKCGFVGAVCATLGVVAPSFIIILIIAIIYSKLNVKKIMNYPLTGLRPAVIGLIGAAAISIASKVFFPDGLLLATFATLSFWTSVVIFVFSLLCLLKKVSPIIVIGISAILGIISGYLLELVG